jgi:hypothetical protein
VMSDYDRMCADHPYRTDETEGPDAVPDAVPDVVHDLTNWVAGQLAERPTRRELKDMVSVVLADRIQWRNAVLQASQARDVWMRKAKEIDGSRSGWEEEAERQAKNVDFWRGKTSESEEECQRLVRLLESAAQGNRRLTRERDAALSLVQAVTAAGEEGPLARLRTHLLAAAEALEEAEGGGVG